jgi:hypothetical protein
MNIIISKDSGSEILVIEVNQKAIFYGNYWDFSVPKDLEKLLMEIEKVNSEVNVTIVKITTDEYL